MGSVVPEVMTGHLADYPDEESILRPFVQNFDVTWARRWRAFGSDLSLYFFKPEKHMERAFGFESEILAVYSQYDALQPRTFQAIEHFLSGEPARGRVDTMITFLISEAAEPVSWVKQYMTANPESRLVAAFPAARLRETRGDSWVVRSLLSDQLYQRDLFNHRLPINNDFFFFGREDLIFDLHNAFKRSENRGLFGLRKTGKTSVFFKLKRLVESTSNDIFIYNDCKFPPNRTCRWDELPERLAGQLTEHTHRNVGLKESHPSDAFLTALSQIDNQTRIALVFDEIEYISPASPLDDHWGQDFVPFWQTISHAQSLFTNLAVFVGGVNPTVVEEDLIGTVQNPLFGIVPHQYLGGLTIGEVRRMLRTLGRPMGIHFTPESVAYIFDQYGGHPLITRIACSIIHRTLRDSPAEFPKTVDVVLLRNSEEYRGAELGFYGGHVVSELRLFYPHEYELMAEIAKGNLADMFGLAVDPIFTTHLNNYGLLKRDRTERPSISMPVIERFVRLQEARENGSQTVAATQPLSERPRWLKNRIEQINESLDELQRLILALKQPILFGPNSYPDSYRLFKMRVVNNETEFATFINTCNRCFVESIESYGKSISENNYFWGRIGQTYPALGRALRRIKVYRHNRVHIRLENKVSEELTLFLSQDLAGQPPTTVRELWFQLQQCVLDDLLVGVLVEADRLS